jgi:UDP-3-O-[3-hydroxymyristoyl] N-acetylglucosamine deacetylase
MTLSATGGDSDDVIEDAADALAPIGAKTHQATLGQAVHLGGVGLHSGAHTQVTILPGLVNQGRRFVRVDLPGAPEVPAHVDALRDTRLSTELASGDATVRTVEHLLAALFGLGIDNARIEIDGPEVPLLDGSAQVWAEAIEAAGRVEQSADRQSNPPFLITAPIWVRHEDQFVVAMPAAELRFSYGIEFDVAPIGNQWHSWAPSQAPFASAIAPARTFGLAHQLEELRQAGLIKGGSLENALVCDDQAWLNPPLRFSNEPVRHKLLDLVGDLSLVGRLPTAHYLAYKASHRLHTQLASQLWRAMVADGRDLGQP